MKKANKLLFVVVLATISLTGCQKNPISSPSQNTSQTSKTSQKTTPSKTSDHYSKTYYTDGLEFELNKSKDGYIVSQYLSPDTEIVIPELYNGLPVREIKESVFQDLQIDKLTLPISLRVIQKNAFRGMIVDSELTELDLPEGLEEIQESAFDDCPSLKTIVIPSTLKTIGSDAFHLCTSLERFKLEKESNYFKVDHSILYTKDGKKLLYYPTALTNTTFDIPNGVEILGDYAIYGNMSLQSVSLPSSLKEIGYRGLAALKNMTTLNLNKANNLKILKDLSLSENEGLTSITLPSSIQEFGKGVLKNDKNLVLAKLNFDYEILPDSTYENCSKLTTVSALPSNLTKIGSNAYRGCLSLTKINIPSTVTEIGSRAFDNCRAFTSLVLPNGLEKIQEACFSNCQSLTSINIPSSLKEIESRAFINCYGLKEMDFSTSSLVKIQESAFYSCSGLTIVKFPSSLKEVGNHAFESCPKISPISFNDGIETIGEYAFAEFVNLSKVYLPKSIKSIGTMAFCSTTKEAKQIHLCFEADKFENAYGKDTMFHYDDSRSTVSYSITRSQYEAL